MMGVLFLNSMMMDIKMILCLGCASRLSQSNSLWNKSEHLIQERHCVTSLNLIKSS